LLILVSNTVGWWLLLQGQKYNCRTEALKVLQSKGGGGGGNGSMAAGVAGTDVAGSPCGSGQCCDGKSKHLCLAVDEQQRCNNEQSLERSGQSWPSTIDNQVLQVTISSLVLPAAPPPK